MIDLVVSNWVFRTSALVLVFTIVLFAGVFLLNYAIARIGTLRELRNINTTGSQSLDTAPGLALRQNHGAWARIIQRIEENGLNLDDSNSDIARLLREAGYASPSAPRVYTLIRILLIFLLPGLFIATVLLQPEPPSILTLYFACAILAVIGIYAPNIYVRIKATGRRKQIINGFPDALDMMLVCVEAGLGLEAALDRVSREMAISHPLISALFSESVMLMRAGASRDDSLRKLAERSGVDEIRSFTTLLIQSDKLGSSIAVTLRVYSAEMREARRMRAEEKAHRLPVLISIPLVVFMLPTMIGVLALPSIVVAVRSIIPALGGGA